jgi:hypothetical protein
VTEDKPHKAGIALRTAAGRLRSARNQRARGRPLRPDHRARRGRALPPFINQHGRCPRCAGRGPIRVHFDRDCAHARGDHFHRTLSVRASVGRAVQRVARCWFSRRSRARARARRRIAVAGRRARARGAPGPRRRYRAGALRGAWRAHAAARRPRCARRRRWRAWRRTRLLRSGRECGDVWDGAFGELRRKRRLSRLSAPACGHERGVYSSKGLAFRREAKLGH